MVPPARIERRRMQWRSLMDVLMNVQNQGTLDTSDISSVVSVGADTALAVNNSQKALRHAIRLGRDAQVKLRNPRLFGPIAETINKLAREVKTDQKA